MFPANSGFLVNAQTGEHVKSVPYPQYLPEPTLEMIVNAVTGAPKSITRHILVPDVEQYLAERTVCQLSPSKIQRKRLLFPAPKFGSQRPMTVGEFGSPAGQTRSNKLTRQMKRKVDFSGKRRKPPNTQNNY